MHRVHNLFPAEWRERAQRAGRPLSPRPLIDNVLSRGRDFRVSFVIASLPPPFRGARRCGTPAPVRARARPRIKLRWKNCGVLLRGRGGLYRARVLVSGTSAFHSRLQIPKITAVERTCRSGGDTMRHGAKRRRRLEFREASHAVGRARYIFLLSCPSSRPFCTTGSR